VPFALVHGQRLYYEDSRVCGAPVIFYHGYLMDHEMIELRWLPFRTSSDALAGTNVVSVKRQLPGLSPLGTRPTVYSHCSLILGSMRHFSSATWVRSHNGL
jgi:hypothetical protein